MNNYPPMQINFKVEAAVHKGLSKMGAEQGYSSATGYAKALFDAAYAARCGETGDRDLHKAVAAMGTAQAAGPDDAALRAEIKRLSDELVAASARDKLLEAANVEVMNLSAEVKRLKGGDKQLADALGKLDKMAAENKALKDAHATQATLIEAAADDREATEIADRMLKEATYKLDAASIEVANLTAENKALKAAKPVEPPEPPEPQPPPRRLVVPTALGSFLVDWAQERAA